MGMPEVELVLGFIATFLVLSLVGIILIWFLYTLMFYLKGVYEYKRHVRRVKRKKRARDSEEVRFREKKIESIFFFARKIFPVRDWIYLDVLLLAASCYF